NRPIWPQGGDRPEGSDPVPDTLDWEAWIGPAPMRPYKGNRAYHDFNWRGVVDFGSGALGDMACHTTDGIYAIMNPGYAATAEPFIMTGPVKDQWPAGMVVKCTYRAKDGRPGFKTFWYEGKDGNGRPFMPDTPEELEADARADDIYDGVQSPHFMEVDILQRSPVNPRLSSPQTLEDAYRPPADPLGQLAFENQVPDFRESAVIPPLHAGVGFQDDVSVDRTYAPAAYFLHLQSISFERQLFQLSLYYVRRYAEVEQGTQRHVAGNPIEWIKDQKLHHDSIPVPAPRKRIPL
ncbi:MAG TPA: hypothetical protein P5057_06785, partial [Acidobacteriota bacterium]|nr:hypothetical protein [Acidobacteriota bacterium]